MRNTETPFAIALCTCNGAAHLEAQLASLRSQCGVAEIVVVDDASTDDTWPLLERHAAADARIRLHRNPQRRGVTANFEWAIARTRAPWVALSDQDDVWEPDKLARLREAWDGRSVLLHHATRRFRGEPDLVEGGAGAGEGRKFRGEDWRRLLYRNTVVGHTLVFRRELAALARPFPHGVMHDWWLGVAAALHGGVQYVDAYLTHYRLHDHNAYHCAGSRLRRLRQEQAMREDLLQSLLARPWLPGAQRRLAAEYHRLLREAGVSRSLAGLWSFYRRHAGLFFAGPDGALSAWRGMRKSTAATLASLVRPAERAGRFRAAPAPGLAARG